MREVLAIAEREFIERKLVLAAGALLAVLTLFTPLLPGVEGFTNRDIISFAALGVSALILFAGALIMGVTSINSDLSERRLGFYFSRPVSGISIWMGKAVGSLAVIVITAMITFLPAVADGFQVLAGIDTRRLALFAWSVLGVYFVGHVAACAARVRSIWLLLDFTGVFVVVVSCWALFRFYYGIVPLHSLGKLLERAGAGALVAAIAIAILASASGLINGRVEPGRVHLWTSLTLWIVFGVVLIGVWMFSLWVAGSEPKDVSATRSGIYFPDAGDGEWMVLYGEARAGLEQGFAARDAKRFLRVGSRGVLYASEARIVALQPQITLRYFPYPAREESTVVLADPTGTGGWKETKIDVPVSSSDPDVSPSGNRIAISDKGTVAVYSLPDERLIKAFALNLDRSDSVRLLDDDRMLVIRRDYLGADGRWPRYHFALSVLDLTTGERKSSFEMEASDWSFDPTGRLVLTRIGSERQVFDLENGTLVGSFLSDAGYRSPRWLSTGVIAMPEVTDDGRRRLRIVEPSGQELRQFDADVTRNDWFWLGLEVRPGVLMASAGPSDTESVRCNERRLLEIDTSKGQVREVARGEFPVWSYNRSLPVGSPAARTACTCDGKVVRYDYGLVKKETILE